MKREPTAKVQACKAGAAGGSVRGMRFYRVCVAVFLTLLPACQQKAYDKCLDDLRRKTESSEICDKKLANEHAPFTLAVDTAYLLFEAQDDERLRVFINARKDISALSDLISLAVPTYMDVPHAEILRSPASYKNRPVMFSGLVLSRKDNAGIATAFVATDRIGGHQFAVIFDSDGASAQGEQWGFVGISAGVYKDAARGIEFPILLALPPMQDSQMKSLATARTRK